MTGGFAKRTLRRRFLESETAELRERLRDAEELLRALSGGEVDAIVRPGAAGEQVFTLKGADHVYRVMVETMSDGAITLTPAGVILYANRRFAELTNTSLWNIMGRRIQEFVEPAEEPALNALLDGSSHEAMQCSIALQSSSRSPVPVYLAIRRLEADGMPCLIAVITDLSDLKRSEAAMRLAAEQFRLAIEAAPTGMLLMSPQGTIVLVNAQIENVFGFSRDELLMMRTEKLVPDYLRGLHSPTHTDSFGASPGLAAGTSATGEMKGIRKDGTEIPIEVAFTPLHTSQGDLMLASIVDLSARREVDRLRTEFVSMVSHELRTPLTAISGSLGLLQSGALGQLPEQSAAMVQIAHRNSARLERIINDILDIGTLEAGKMAMQISDVALEELLQQAVEASAGYAELCEVRYLLDCGPVAARVKADPSRLVQVVTNLLSNAAKFSPPGADVHIRVRPGPARVRVEVEDSGVGIPEAFQSRIFEKFAKGDPPLKQRVDGCGLGLSIARKLIDAMDGCIGFTSVVNQGTVFYLEVPRADLQMMTA